MKLLFFLAGLSTGLGLALVLVISVCYLVAIKIMFWEEHHRRRHRHHVQVGLYIDGKKGIPMLLADDQQVTVTATIEDVHNVPVPGAVFDAPPTYTLDDASFGTLTPSADGLSALLVPNGKQGVCHIQFAASVGGNAFQGQSEDINVVPGAATQVQLVLGAPVAQAAPAAPAQPTP